MFQARQRSQAQHLGNLPADLGGRAFLHFQPVGNVFKDVQVRENSIALKHHGHGAAVRGHVVQALAIQHDAPLRRGFKTGDEAQGGRLAASRRTQEGDELPLGDVKRDIVYSGHFPLAGARREGLGEVLKGEIPAGHCFPLVWHAREVIATRPK